MSTEAGGGGVDAMNAENLMDGRRQCRAKSKNSGVQCKRAPVPGAPVCRMHGGAAPQVLNAARNRLLAAADGAAAVLVDIIMNPEEETQHRLRAVTALLDRAGLGTSSKVDVVSSNITLPEDEADRIREKIAAERARLRREAGVLD